MKKKLFDIYTVLVRDGGASEYMRTSFIHSHEMCECAEWRFSGKLGFGGKYRVNENKVDFYAEDSTPERIKIRDLINAKLNEL